MKRFIEWSAQHSLRRACRRRGARIGACSSSGGGGRVAADRSVGRGHDPRPGIPSTSRSGASSRAPTRRSARTRCTASQIAVDDKGGKLLGHDIKLTTEDGLCTPEGGATAAQKLAADKTIVGLVGSSCSDETVGGIKTLTDAGLTTISPSNTRPALTASDRGPEYAGYLRTAHSDAFQGKAVAEFVFNA